jgi:Flp pilus assembly protein TadD
VSSSTDQLWQRAQHHIEVKQLAAARATLETLLRQAPGHTSARMLLASTILNLGQVREATRQAVMAAQSPPQDAKTICLIAQFLIRLGEMTAARDCLQHPATLRVRDGRVLAALGHAHERLGDHVSAMAFMDRARAVGYNNPDFRYFHSLQLQYNGHMAEAQSELEACVRAGTLRGRVSLTLARLRKQTPENNHLDSIRRQLQSVKPGSEDHAAFEFAQFKELEDLRDYPAAFSALQRGNEIMYRRVNHDTAHEQALFNGVIARCTAEFMRPHATTLEGPTPIFIVGLPRSGTTLLDRILGNHSKVISTGERSDFPRQLDWTADYHSRDLLDDSLMERADNIDYAELGSRYLAQTQWRARGKPFYVDKLPPNYMLLGFIHRALPHAPILHMVRDPMDVCFSNYKALFGDASYSYSYNFSALAAHYASYRRLMRHWHAVMPGRIFDVDYTRLVNDPEGLIRPVLDYCGLPYEPDCADLSRNTAAVDSLSSAQVREPIHTRTLGEWRHYEPQLQPLRDLLQGSAHL